MLVVSCVALLAAPTGCSKKKGASSSYPQEPADAAAVDPEDLDALVQALGERERELRAYGPAPASPVGGAAGGDAVASEEAEMQVEAASMEAADDAEPAATRQPSRCEQICGLASAICQLETNICALSERHPDTPRYQDACARAQGDCELAKSACHACS
jgi:hypothetical protein